MLPYAVQSMAWQPNGHLFAIGFFMKDEVSVWNIKEKKHVFSVRSNRLSANLSGQEILFSLDGRYLITQDFSDSKAGSPPFPKVLNSTQELKARKDMQRYVLAKVWDLETRKEVATIKGPGSIKHGGRHIGMCLFDNGRLLVLLRKGGFTTYELPSGEMIRDVDLSHPFSDHPKVGRSYEKMACNPSGNEIALAGLQFFRDAEKFGYVNWSGATAIVVADVRKGSVKKVLFSETPLNGVVYTKSGNYLASFGKPPIRVWNAAADFQLTGVVNDPSLNSGNLVAAGDSERAFGIADQAYIWDLAQLRKVARFDIPRDVIRVAEKDNSYAIAEGNTVHFFKLK